MDLNIVCMIQGKFYTTVFVFLLFKYNLNHFTWQRNFYSTTTAITYSQRLPSPNSSSINVKKDTGYSKNQRPTLKDTFRSDKR